VTGWNFTWQSLNSQPDFKTTALFWEVTPCAEV